MNIYTKEIDVNHRLYPQVYQLREEILRKPIGLSLEQEDLSNEVKEKVIIAVDDHEEVLGCIMIKDAGDGLAKFRQMAVKPELQGLGVGKKILNAAEENVWRNGYKKIALHARITAQLFYSKAGYALTSDVFTEVTIPHVVMEKERPDDLQNR